MAGLEATVTCGMWYVFDGRPRCGGGDGGGRVTGPAVDPGGEQQHVVLVTGGGVQCRLDVRVLLARPHPQRLALAIQTGGVARTDTAEVVHTVQACSTVEAGPRGAVVNVDLALRAAPAPRTGAAVGVQAVATLRGILAGERGALVAILLTQVAEPACGASAGQHILRDARIVDRVTARGAVLARPRGALVKVEVTRPACPALRAAARVAVHQVLACDKANAGSVV